MASCPRWTGSKLPRMHASCVEEGEEEVNKEEPVSHAHSNDLFDVCGQRGAIKAWLLRARRLALRLCHSTRVVEVIPKQNKKPVKKTKQKQTKKR
jgi:hypothetical protein